MGSKTGVDFERELSVNQVVKDLSSPLEKCLGFLRRTEYAAGAAAVFIAFCFTMPSLLELWILMAAFCCWYSYGAVKKAGLPGAVPLSSGRWDPNHINDNGSIGGPGQGIAFMGNEAGTDREFWLSDKHLRTHSLILGTTGSGKAQPLYSMVHTPEGWVPMGQIKKGSVVSTPDGGTATVMGVFPQGKIEIFELVFEDGRSARACFDHLWRVTENGLEPENLTTSQILERLALGRPLAIPLPAPVEKPEIVGVNFNTAGLMYGMHSMAATIPAIYMMGSVAQRTDFIRGVLSVGHEVRGRDTVYLEVESRALAEGIAQIIRSLGGIGYIDEEPKASGKTKYSVTIRHERLKDLVGEVALDAIDNSQERLLLGIKRIVKVAPAEAQCILIDSRDHLYITDGYVVTHNTELLIALATNAMIHDSGLIYIDGKADSSLYAKLFVLARLFLREDDLLVINFQTGAEDVFGPQSRKRSNSMNPYAFGSAGMLSQTTVGLVQAEDAKSDMWSERAVSFVEALMPLMTFMRDNFGWELDVNVIREFFDMTTLENIVWHGVTDYARTEEERNLMNTVMSGLRNYLANVPGYDKKNMGKHPPETLQQHGFITMQLIRTFSSLADTYGYIMRTPFPEIDYRDVFLNRRILVVLLPSLEKSPAELTNLGKINVASIKATMAVGLGAHIEGEFKELIDSKQSESPSPFIMIFDEYGYFAVKGFAVVPAQVRSIGCSANFAGQDLPAFQKASKEEAESTTANTTTQYCGKLQCPVTYEFFSKIAGQGYFSKATGYEGEQGNAGLSYLDNHRISVERMDRVTMDILSSQTSGDWHVFREGKIVRIRGFYAAPLNVEGKPKNLRVNHFIPVAPPTEEEKTGLYLGLHRMAIGSTEGFGDIVDINPDALTERVASMLQLANISALDPLNAMRVAIAATDLDNNNDVSRVIEDMDDAVYGHRPIREAAMDVRFGEVTDGSSLSNEDFDALANETAARRRRRSTLPTPTPLEHQLPPGGILFDGGTDSEPGILNEEETFLGMATIDAMTGADIEETIRQTNETMDLLADASNYPVPPMEISREEALMELLTTAESMVNELEFGGYSGVGDDEKRDGEQ